jgi:hypothetical protein
VKDVAKKPPEKFKGSPNLRHAWMMDLCAFRGSVGHGHPLDSYPPHWSARSHLLLASVIFPLAVKLVLQKAGSYARTEEDRKWLFYMDYLLAEDDLFKPIEEEEGIAFSFGWHQALEQACLARASVAFESKT